MNFEQYQITFEWDDDDFYQDNFQTLSRLPTPDVLAEKSEVALQATMQAIEHVGERFAHSLQSLAFPPDGAEIEFGVRLGADAGVITKNNNNAHFVVKLVWKQG